MPKRAEKSPCQKLSKKSKKSRQDVYPCLYRALFVTHLPVDLAELVNKYVRIATCIKWSNLFLKDMGCLECDRSQSYIVWKPNGTVEMGEVDSECSLAWPIEEDLEDSIIANSIIANSINSLFTFPLT
jgi:hypothetical protein